VGRFPDTDESELNVTGAEMVARRAASRLVSLVIDAQAGFELLLETGSLSLLAELPLPSVAAIGDLPTGGQPAPPISWPSRYSACGTGGQ
jgi:hypothetical protein